jgi:hypothetical protein
MFTPLLLCILSSIQLYTHVIDVIGLQLQRQTDQKPLWGTVLAVKIHEFSVNLDKTCSYHLHTTKTTLHQAAPTPNILDHTGRKTIKLSPGFLHQHNQKK